jgi:hypothetical protein
MRAITVVGNVVVAEPDAVRPRLVGVEHEHVHDPLHPRHSAIAQVDDDEPLDHVVFGPAALEWDRHVHLPPTGLHIDAEDPAISSNVGREEQMASR